MKSFWSLIPKNIYKNKKRSFFMVIGIILATSLITSISIMIETGKKAAYPIIIDANGGVHDSLLYTKNKLALDKLLEDPVVDKAAVMVSLGTYKQPESNYTLEIKGCDKNITELLNLKLLEGRLPEDNNEIILQDWMLENMPIKYKLGDKIKIPVELEYRGINNKTEVFNKEYEFTLVGVFKHDVSTSSRKNISTAYVSRKYVDEVLPENYIAYDGYITINSNYSIQKGISLLSQTEAYRDIFFTPNSQKATVLELFKVINFISLALYIIIGVVAGVIIYNIFNVSVTERIKEFGMLKAIGASPGDIILLVIGEGLILGVLFIPIGILIGNSMMKSLIIIAAGYREFNGIMNIPVQGILASVVIVILTIIGGAYTPARRAGKISAIEAINSNNNLDLSSKKLKNKLYGGKLLGLNIEFSTDMALLYINRNKKRFMTTVVSLSITIIMFMLVNYIIKNLDTAENIKYRLGGDFVLQVNSIDPKSSISDSDIKDIKNIKGVGEVNNKKEFGSTLEISDGKVTDEGLNFLKKESKKSNYALNNFNNKVYQFDTMVLGYTEEELDDLKKYILEGKIDTVRLKEKPAVIMIQNLNYSNYTNLHAGDEIKLSYPYYNEKGDFVNYRFETFTIDALLKQEAAKSGSSFASRIIMDSAACETYLRNRGYQNISITIEKNANYADVEAELKDRIRSNRNINMISAKEEIEFANKKYLVISMLMYSLIIIISIVSIMNLVNIMSMNVLLRKREMAMLRAVGFGIDEVKRMIRTEGMLYGFISAFWGTTIGVIFTFLAFLTTRRMFPNGLPWRFPIVTVLIVFFISVLICLLSAMNASRRLFTSSIVEAIRTIE
jgi:ABC-type antimicrobial peptide transport system permease subunit